MTTVKDVIFAFICINLAVFIVNSIGTFNQLVNKPYYTPEIISRQFNVPSNWQALIPSGTGFAGGAIAIVSGYTGAGLAILLIAALMLFWEPARWAITGMSDLAMKLGAPQPIVTVIDIICTIVWVIFIVEFIGGRRVE